MNLIERVAALSSAEPFQPFRIAASSGEAWIVETRECLTFDSSTAMLRVMIRGDGGWRDLHLRTSQLVSVDRASEPLALPAESSTDLP